MNKVANNTSADATGRVILLYLLHNLSTIGFNEHEITNAAKNNIATSFICAKNMMNSIAKTKNIKFFIPTYFVKNLIIDYSSERKLYNYIC